VCYTVSMFTSVGDLQYVAGLYEGEGNCGSRRYERKLKNSSRCQLKIKMTNREPLDKVIEIIGFGKIYGPYKDKSQPKNKPYYIYIISSFEKVQAFIAMIWLWLSHERQEQACDCLDKDYLYEYDYIA